MEHKGVGREGTGVDTRDALAQDAEAREALVREASAMEALVQEIYVRWRRCGRR